MSEPPIIPAPRSQPDDGPTPVEVPSDIMLVDAARAGDSEATAELYRRHSVAAGRFAAQLTGNRADADDLVSEAFVSVLASMSTGGGPTLAFRPYLLTTIRRQYIKSRTSGREDPVDDL